MFNNQIILNGAEYSTTIPNKLELQSMLRELQEFYSHNPFAVKKTVLTVIGGTTHA